LNRRRFAEAPTSCVRKVFLGSPEIRDS
jgi:hypothetical protein